MAKRTQVPLGRAKFDVNRRNESPLRGENADFRPVSKLKYRLTPLRGVLPVNFGVPPQAALDSTRGCGT